MKRTVLPYIAVTALASIWGGLVAIKHKNDHKAHFVDYCRERASLSSEMYRTVHELLKISGSNDCQTAFERLNSKYEINLSFRGISRLEPLRDFKQLKKLTLIENKIEDLAPIQGLSALEELDISFNKVESLNALNGMKLRILSASDNPLAQVDELRDLPEVRFMDISEGQLAALPDTSKMENLRDLIAVNNRIDSNGLREIHSKSLKFLKLDKNRISDLNFLKNLPNLIELSINSNQLKELSGLPADVKLKALALAGNQLTDIKPIFKLPELLVVDAKSNRIHKFDMPEKVSSLRRIDLRFNQIEGAICKDNSPPALCNSIVI